MGKYYIQYASTEEEACQVSDEEFLIDAGGGKTIFWDTRRNREVMTRHRDSLAAQAHEASRYGLGHVRSRRLRAWYMLPAELDEGGAEILAYLDLLDADLAALADMSHGDMLVETEVTTPSDPHSGAPPGGAREVRPHHVATMICANKRTKEAGHVARLHTDTII